MFAAATFPSYAVSSSVELPDYTAERERCVETRRPAPDQPEAGFIASQARSLLRLRRGAEATARSSCTLAVIAGEAARKAVLALLVARQGSRDSARDAP